MKSVAALFVSFINWQKSNSERFQLGSSRNSESHVNICIAFSSLSCTNLAADCPAGSYSSVNRTCILCPRGTYQPSRGRPSCISCGLNLTTHSSGTVDKKHCISKLINSSCNIYALPLATQQYIKGAAFPAARLLGPNNINNTYSNLE